MSVTPDGSTAYFDSCCEPAAGLVSVVPDRRQPGARARSTPGLGPAVSPDGRFLAYTAINAVVVRDLTTGQEQIFTDPAYDESPLFGDVTWSRGRHQARTTRGSARRSRRHGRQLASLVELTVTPGADATGPRRGPRCGHDEPAGLGRRQHRVRSCSAPSAARRSAGPQDGELLVDPTTGETGQTTVAGVLDRSVNRTSGQLLFVRSDGHLIVGAADLGPGYALAAW